MKLTWRSIFLISLWLCVAVAEAIYRLYVLKSSPLSNEVNSWLGNLWYFFSIFIVAILIKELFSFRKLNQLEVTRNIIRILPVGCFAEVVVVVNNPVNKSFKMELIDHYPDYCEINGLPIKFLLKSGEKKAIRYQLKPLERGDLTIAQLELWIDSSLSLLRRRIIFDCNSESKVYPNYRSTHHYELLASEQLTHQLGIRQRQQRGDGLDFLQLREYRMGDSLRQIDWRASSRLNKLISKEYQQERDQNIIFMLDSGRRMRTKDNLLSHFDQALNALLLVTSIALKQGDAVGLKVLGNEEFFLAPQKGPANMPRLLNQLYSLQPGNEASDLVSATQDLIQKFKKRSLVVIISSFRTEDELELKTALSLLKKHHLVILINLKEQILQDTLTTDISSFEQAIKFSQTIDYLQHREKLHQRLACEGTITVDSLAKNLAANMVNYYFDIKRSGRL